MSSQGYILAVWLAGAAASAIYLTIARAPRWQEIAPKLDLPPTRTAFFAAVAFTSSAWFLMPLIRLLAKYVEDER